MFCRALRAARGVNSSSLGVWAKRCTGGLDRVTMPRTLTDDELQRVYAWIDEIPLSRPKRNINRDFSDGGTCFCVASQGPALVAGAVYT